MDSMEINKIMGAVVGSLLIYLGVQFFADQIFHPAGHGDEHDYAYALEIEESGGGTEEEQVDFGALLAEADPARGERVFGKCKACHKLDGTNATGPHLDGVVGRAVDAVDGFAYSGALEAVVDTWSPENLQHFLANPRKFAPGTAMGFAGLPKIEDRAALVAYLQTQGG
ncbi:cytochrome c [Albimonas donghaensis]|uniref:Cytochrome c n=1 Tax=Albimonas donghaensis TaxID=356660 RepID=A0A1H3AMF0_9RHOB|nr:cytochrome c family protein [Albimonas donghaensis]SDX30910.1 cytochrome c [Albimonas donghaensis]